VKSVARPTLRHRIILNFEGEAEGIDPDTIIDAILAETPEG
jgi:MoxR-like ATPase